MRFPGRRAPKLLVAERQVTLKIGGSPGAGARGGCGRSRTRVSGAHRVRKRSRRRTRNSRARAGSGNVDSGRARAAAARCGCAAASPTSAPGRAGIWPSQVPDEVRPLVDEVNALLDARERTSRARGTAPPIWRTALKTPLAALAADGDRLRQKGETRSRTRSKRSSIRCAATSIANSPAPGCAAAFDLRRDVDHASCAAGALADRNAVANGRPARSLRYETAIARRCHRSVRSDRSRGSPGQSPGERDAACKDACAGRRRQVSVDGLAIMSKTMDRELRRSLRSAALARGGRLDERGGRQRARLAIVQDVLEAYGWTLQLDISELGGLQATCRAGARPAGRRA